jgi:hypothetical protein
MLIWCLCVCIVYQDDSEDVEFDKESRDKKSRYTLKKLLNGGYPRCRDGDSWFCPFCKRSIGTDFDGVVRHAESLGSSHARLDQMRMSGA